MSKASEVNERMIDKVYTAARLLGRSNMTYDRAKVIAAKFTELELDRIVNRATEKLWRKRRLTLVKS